LLWSWAETRNVTDAFTDALGWCQVLFGCTPVRTYQGFLGALSVWTRALLPVVVAVLQQRMQQSGSRCFRVDGWVPIAFDGSRSSAPRTKANEAALCAKNYGQGKTAKYRKKKSQGLRRKRNQQQPAQPQEPQAWITLLWHTELRLPWCWRLGPSHASERDHVMTMVEAGGFPQNTLFCGDAGFVGYPLWSTIRTAGQHFLVRVGGNVSLLAEQTQCKFVKEGKERFVWCWPKTAAAAAQPPLRLRLVQVRIGQTKVWLLTSVLNRKELSVRALRRLYQKRWGVEVEFRGLKQTLQRAKLRCRNSQRLLAELDWSILAMAVVELFALKEQLARRSAARAEGAAPGDPSKRSLAQALRALRDCLKQLKERPQPGQDLVSRLRQAVTDSYQRKSSKKARYRPPNPDKKPLGDPKIRQLDKREAERLRKIGRKMAA
jgi:hypothetical protein